MPVEPLSADQPTTKPPYADTLAPNVRPALSATSDMPKFNAPDSQPAPEVPPVDNEVKPADASPTSEEAPVAEPEGEADAQPQADKPAQEGGEGQDKTSPQQRAAFARERNRRQAAEQRATALETKVDQLIEVVSKLTPKAEEPKADPRPVMPRRDAFDSPDAFDQALIAHDKAVEDWAGRRAAEAAKAEAKAELEQQNRDRQAETQRETYEARKTAFEADHPDFEDIVMSDDLKISPIVTLTIMEAADGPAIAYYLGQNPDEAERIYNMGLINPKAPPGEHRWTQAGTVNAALEIGKISTRLATPPKPRPAPIRPLAARNSATEKSPDEMSMAEYAAWRKTRAAN